MKVSRTPRVLQVPSDGTGLLEAIALVQEQIAAIRDEGDRLCRSYSDELAIYRAAAYHHIAANMEKGLLMALMKKLEACSTTPTNQPVPRVTHIPPPTVPEAAPVEPGVTAVEVPASYDTTPPEAL